MAKTGGVMIALDLGKKKPPMDEEDDGSAGAEEEALADFFSKGKSGDIKGAHDALKTYMSLCYPMLNHGDDEYEEGEAPEEG